MSVSIKSLNKTLFSTCKSIAAIDEQSACRIFGLKADVVQKIKILNEDDLDSFANYPLLIVAPNKHSFGESLKNIHSPSLQSIDTTSILLMHFQQVFTNSLKLEISDSLSAAAIRFSITPEHLLEFDKLDPISLANFSNSRILKFHPTCVFPNLNRSYENSIQKARRLVSGLSEIRHQMIPDLAYAS